jgi:hypothetical protein
MKKLKVGDEVLIRVRRTNVADLPKKTRATEPQQLERNERQEFKWVKSRYLKLRRKYERRQPKAPRKEHC